MNHQGRIKTLAFPWRKAKVKIAYNALDVEQYIFCDTLQFPTVNSHWLSKNMTNFYNDKKNCPKVKEWWIITIITSQYALLNLIFHMSCLGNFQYVRDILQVTVLMDHPVKKINSRFHIGRLDNLPLNYLGTIMVAIQINWHIFWKSMVSG